MNEIEYITRRNELSRRLERLYEFVNETKTDIARLDEVFKEVKKNDNI